MLSRLVRFWSKFCFQSLKLLSVLLLLQKQLFSPLRRIIGRLRRSCSWPITNALHYGNWAPTSRTARTVASRSVLFPRALVIAWSGCTARDWDVNLVILVLMVPHKKHSGVGDKNFEKISSFKFYVSNGRQQKSNWETTLSTWLKKQTLRPRPQRCVRKHFPLISFLSQWKIQLIKNKRKTCNNSHLFWFCWHLLCMAVRDVRGHNIFTERKIGYFFH